MHYHLPCIVLKHWKYQVAQNYITNINHNPMASEINHSFAMPLFALSTKIFTNSTSRSPLFCDLPISQTQSGFGRYISVGEGYRPTNADVHELLRISRGSLETCHRRTIA